MIFSVWEIFILQNAKPVEDPLVKIREEREAAKKEDEYLDSNVSITERVSKSVIPYAHLSYEEQVRYIM